MDRTLALSSLSKDNLISILDAVVTRYGEDAVSIVKAHAAKLCSCWILKLPQNTTSVLVKEWLTLVELAKFDSAICNHRLRPAFLDLLRYEKLLLTLPVNYETRDPRQVAWLLLRGIKLQSLHFSDLNPSENPFHGYLEFVGPYLKEILLENCSFVSERFLKQLLYRSPHLLELTLIKNDGLDQSLLQECISYCPYLKRLRLKNTCRHNPAIPPGEGDQADEAIIFQGVRSVGLEHLCLDVHFKLRNDVLVAIVKSCPQLQTLNLKSSGRQLQTFAFVEIGLQSHCLTHFCVNQCLNLNDAALFSIADGCRLLTLLDICGCPAYTEEGLAQILRSCSLLRLLDVSENLLIGSAILHEIPGRLPSLEELRINNCQSITVEGVVSIMKLCARLHTLKMYGFSEMFDNAVRHALYAGKYWLGTWMDRKLIIYQSSSI